MHTPRREQAALISDFLPLTAYPVPPSTPAPIQKKRRYALPLTVLLVVLASLTTLILPHPQPGQTNTLQAAAIGGINARPELAPVNTGLPVRLRIPKLNIDAAVDYVGLTTSGDLDVPNNPTSVAWYKQGPRPGENGNAVIDGHFGWKGGIPAVFDNLHKLQKGDRLQVEDENKLVTTFVVRELRQFGPDETVPEVFKSNDTKAHLNLITCQGSWIKNQKSYSSRLVVFTDKVAG